MGEYQQLAHESGSTHLGFPLKRRGIHGHILVRTVQQGWMTYR
jgi:hypothetical protein